MRVLVLQHDRLGELGAYERVLAERRAEIELVELNTVRRLPDWRDFHAILALGGQASIAASSPPGWLAHERRYVRDAVMGGVPYWGVCFGAQVLAASLGARVYRGPKPEVGIHRISLTDTGRSDPVFRGAPRELHVFQWHGDGFELPRGAVLLAGSASYPNQAFRWGAHAYGIQFHLEASPQMARGWASWPGYAAQLAEELDRDRVTHVLAALEAHSVVLGAMAASLLGTWLERAQRAAAAA